MRYAGLLLLISLGCVSDSGRMYSGAERPAGELALVEVNRYAQKRELRWVIADVRIPDGHRTEGTFNIPAGEHTLEVSWAIYDTGQGSLSRALLAPITDRATRIDAGVETIPFTAEAGRFYRLRWTSRADASIDGNRGDMELRLVAAGVRPRLAAAGEE